MPTTDLPKPVTSRIAFGLLRRRTLVVPSWRGWLLLLVIFGGGCAALLFRVLPYLAITDSKPGGVLVLEGWANDDVVKAAIAEYDRGGYQDFVVTGGPLDKGSPLMTYKDNASLGAATIWALRPELRDVVRPVPAPPVREDRTLTSAVALRTWLAEHGKSPKRINLITFGCHARRSRNFFREAFAGQAEVGVISVPDPNYDRRFWWTNSYGFREVSDETIAYLYSLLR